MKALAASTVGTELLAVMLLFSLCCMIISIRIGLTCSPKFSSFHYLKTCSPGEFMVVILSLLSGGFLYFKM